jgi:hypothetical protein
MDDFALRMSASRARVAAQRKSAAEGYANAYGATTHNRNSGQQLAWPMGVPPVKQEPLPLMREVPTPDPYPTDALGPMRRKASPSERGG